MRTTLTLDEDVALKLQKEARRSGRAFKEVVNELLRRALNERPRAPQKPFQVHAYPLGLQPGVSIDHVSELLEHIDGPAKL